MRVPSDVSRTRRRRIDRAAPNPKAPKRQWTARRPDSAGRPSRVSLRLNLLLWFLGISLIPLVAVSWLGHRSGARRAGSDDIALRLNGLGRYADRHAATGSGGPGCVCCEQQSRAEANATVACRSDRAPAMPRGIEPVALGALGRLAPDDRRGAARAWAALTAMDGHGRSVPRGRCAGTGPVQCPGRAPCWEWIWQQRGGPRDHARPAPGGERCGPTEHGA